MKCRLSIIHVLLFLCLAESNVFGKSVAEPVRLTCEYLMDPIAINRASPVLGWQVNAPGRGAVQLAYRIIAASSLKELDRNKGDLWDSGRVESDRSQQVFYAGDSLVSRQQVFWKVMIWDGNGNPGRWSRPAVFSMGLLEPDDWKASWIGLQEDLTPDSKQTCPAPFFRKVFSVSKPVKRAKAYVSGLGFYEFYLNGMRIGSQVLAPAVTNYDRRSLQRILYPYDDQSAQRVLYNVFDVTSNLRRGDNAAGVLLGNGWYNQRDRTVEGCMWYSTPRMIVQLEIMYTDGTTESILSDTTWKSETGPILHDGIFTGEVYDARLEADGWNREEYDDSRWKNALLMTPPKGRLEAQTAPFDEIVREIKPVLREKKSDGVYRFDIPENISGWVTISVRGNTGDTVSLRFFGEEGHDFGQTDTYILRGNPEGESWSPRFTWHTFRWFEVAATGNVVLDTDRFVVKVVNTHPGRTGKFTTGNSLFERLNENYIRTQEANFHGSISSDCPHRERLAYTGDGQVLAETSLYTYNMTQFYRKWLDDMDDARNRVTGYVPHTAPFGGGGGGPAWGSAIVIIPWAYYTFYGDTAFLAQHFGAMKQWVGYLGTRTDQRGIVVREEPGGWCLGEWCTPDKVEISEPLVNTAYYYHVADLVGRIAGVLGREDDRKYYTRLAAGIKENFNKEFYNPSTGHYWEGRQGADVLPLAFGLVPDDLTDRVFSAFLNHLASLDWHFDTGILTTPLTLKVLDRYGRSDLSYRLMNQTTYPSFGFYVMDSRYTTLWENWNGTQSRCHPMFGSVVSWFYETLGGIRPDPDRPGMKHFFVSPQFLGETRSFAAEYESLYGKIRSEWQRKDTISSFVIDIPANTTATFILPARGSLTERGNPVKIGNGILDIKENSLLLGSGNYRFILTTNR